MIRLKINNITLVADSITNFLYIASLIWPHLFDRAKYQITVMENRKYDYATGEEIK